MNDKHCRSVSIKGETHEMLREKAKEEGIPMSTAVEREINLFLIKEAAKSLGKPLRQ